MLVDEYSHPSSDVIYTPVNVPGPGVEIDEFESQIIEGCSCENSVCLMESECECIAKYGRNYNEDFKLVDNKYNGPIMECNSSCACHGSNCGNRLVQKGPLPYLEIYNCTGKGKALRPTHKIDPGTFVCEYAGEIIGEKEGIRRIKSQSDKDMNYIFHLKEHLSGGSIIQTFIDPSFLGNIGRYINHSCDPNCCVVPTRVDSPVARLAIFSLCTISAGEEITFDYGLVNKCSDLPDLRLKACLCGKLKCRGFLPYDSSF